MRPLDEECVAKQLVLMAVLSLLVDSTHQLVIERQGCVCEQCVQVVCLMSADDHKAPTPSKCKSSKSGGSSAKSGSSSSTKEDSASSAKTKTAPVKPSAKLPDHKASAPGQTHLIPSFHLD